MNIKLNKKFTDRDLDEFIDRLYWNAKQKPNDNYVFDLTDVEFIGNQELLVLTAIFKSFFDSHVVFKVEFIKEGMPTTLINERVKRQLIQIWEVWRIPQIVPTADTKKYFGIDGRTIETLKKDINYYPKSFEIYTRNGVTPFVSLDFVNNFYEAEVQERIQPIYRLNSVIEKLLEINNCSHPFTSQSLSSIITEELYLNFLDHSVRSSFPNFYLTAFMSISFHPKLDESRYTAKGIQNIRGLNFKTEYIDETKTFFYDKQKNEYKNTPFIQFSFLDFGQGIVASLKEEYSKHTPQEDKISDSDVLKFAFKHDSSRHPLFDDDVDSENYITRGLFDVLILTKRYKGLLVVRSNEGKILFDFSTGDTINKAVKYFGNKKQYFPGTLISIYLPAIEDIKKLDISAIKPEYFDFDGSKRNIKYLSLHKIVDGIDKFDKAKLYRELLINLRSEITNDKPSLVYISFKNSEWIEKKVLKKILFFLLSDYEINHLNNVIVLHSPNKLVEEIQVQILGLNEAIKNFKIHPLPIIDYKEETVRLNWLGIYEDEDKRKLDRLLFDQYSLAKSDFIEPQFVDGNLNTFDRHGNLYSTLPNADNLIEVFNNIDDKIAENELQELLNSYNCILRDDGKSLYLGSRNFYQKEYVILNNLLNNKKECDYISKNILDKIISRITLTDQHRFIGVSTSSHKIVKSLVRQKLIGESDYLNLDSRLNFEQELSEANFNGRTKCILICDVISTGYLALKVEQKLKDLQAELDLVVVVLSTLDPEFQVSKDFMLAFENRIIYLYNYPIKRYLPSEILGDLANKEIIRVNPDTNIPITLSIDETSFNHSVIFRSEIVYHEKTNEIEILHKFLDKIDQDCIKIGFLKFNNIIHPYFFNTKIILEQITDETLGQIFREIGKEYLEKDLLHVFYPRESGMKHFNIHKLQEILNNDGIDEIEIERIGTTEGWRFPHNSDYLNAVISNNVCLILDDGSCSGDSLIQMIDEIAFYEAKEIILLCFIGRVHDHKREFFSRLSSIRVKGGNSVPLSIYFVTHWHIPTYYIDDNPNTREINWLNEVIGIQNTPQGIKKIVYSILKQITPKQEYKFEGYKYLPKIRGTNAHPKRELLLIREELGKVIGYRLYKESFNYFNLFNKKYNEIRVGKDRYKDIELLSAVFIYETYLYDKMASMLPDIVEKMERFVRLVIFEEERIYDKLTYEWNKKDLVHLFFIVFKNEKLITELTPTNFLKLIEFADNVESTTNYVLYKLLKYFPLTAGQLNEKHYHRQLREIIERLKNDEKTKSPEIRKYYNFLMTLPSSKDFRSQLSLLRASYAQQTEPEYHDEKKSFNHNVSLIIATIGDLVEERKSNLPFDIGKVATIRRSWFKMADFVNPILRFSSTFQEFLAPYPYFELITQTNLLRERVGFIDDVIFSLSESFYDFEKLNAVINQIISIQSDFEVNSTFHQVIKTPNSDCRDFIQKFKSTFFNLVEMGELAPNGRYEVRIPQVYLDKILTIELITNMREYSSSDEMEKIFIEYALSDKKEIIIKISNKISKEDTRPKNGEGLKCLTLMSESDLFDFKFSYGLKEDIFTQTLTFKVH